MEKGNFYGDLIYINYIEVMLSCDHLVIINEADWCRLSEDKWKTCIQRQWKLAVMGLLQQHCQHPNRVKGGGDDVRAAAELGPGPTCQHAIPCFVLINMMARQDDLTKEKLQDCVPGPSNPGHLSFKADPLASYTVTLQSRLRTPTNYTWSLQIANRN